MQNTNETTTGTVNVTVTVTKNKRKRTHSRTFPMSDAAGISDFLTRLGCTAAAPKPDNAPWYLCDSSRLFDGECICVSPGCGEVTVIWRGDDLTPAIGDVVTVTVYTDRYTADVVAVSKSGRKITLRRRNAIMVTKPEFVPGGFAAHCTKNATWRTESDPDGSHVDATLRNTGEWKISGHPTRSPGMTVHAGDSHHYDYNF